MIHAVPLEPNELTHSDLSWIRLATEGTETGVDLSWVLQRAFTRDVRVWRFVGDRGTTGIMVTRIFENPRGRELNVMFVAGKGLVRNKFEIRDAIRHYAREQNCATITTEVDNAPMRRLVASVGGRPFSITYRLEGVN